VLGAILLEVAASAALTVAFMNRKYESSRLYDRLIEESESQPRFDQPGRLAAEIRGSLRALEDPLPWLVAGSVLAVLGLALLVVARRRR
jgi:hypothetical protein